jgi:pimeloyl-ACP methyl ester carboxylesterase
VVILGAGYSFDWALVQPDVSRFTQVCAYDHSGIAWSDPGPIDSCSLRVSEIHWALRNAKISGPYVLVGHSLGALVARLYTAKYADEVAGMVIAEHAFLGSLVLPTANSPRSGAPPPPTGSSSVPAAPPNPTPFQKLPSFDYQLHLWANSLPGVSKIMQRNIIMTPEYSSTWKKHPGVRRCSVFREASDCPQGPLLPYRVMRIYRNRCLLFRPIARKFWRITPVTSSWLTVPIL